MNAAIRAILRVATQFGAEVVGVENGYQGLIDGRFLPLGPRDLDATGHTGGTILGSARCDEFRTRQGRAIAAKNLAEFDGLVVIGGNGSLAGALALAVEHEVAVAGLPASIDNDIGCTALSVGVDSALNTIVQACDRISDTARAHNRAFVIEVMGRECGYLAMAGAVASGADAVVFREQGRSDEELVERLQTAIQKGFAAGKRRFMVIKAEGVALPTHTLVERLEKGLGPELAGVTVRGTVLGHLIRGGNPSYQDRMIAGRLGNTAVRALLGGQSGFMAAWQPPGGTGDVTTDPSVRLVPLPLVLRETARLLDGSSPVTQRRLRMMSEVEGILAL
jgi:6-phosphofructokinase 1